MHSNEEHHKHSEIQKLVGLLNIEEKEILFLNSLTVENLSFLRMKVTSAILEEQSGIWEPLARVSKFMPNFINAKVSEDILGPKITANITYHVPVKDALAIASYFSTNFFCNVLENIVPEKIEHIINESPFELMRKVVLELRRRKNYLLIGSLIDYTPIPVVHKVSLEFSESEMIEIIEYISKRARMVELLEMYEDPRVIGLIRSSIQLEKMEGLLEVFSYVGNKTRDKIGRLIERLSSQEKDSYKKTAESFGIVVL